MCEEHKQNKQNDVIEFSFIDKFLSIRVCNKKKQLKTMLRNDWQTEIC